MRVLRIRGQNIRSLHGAFEVDLSSGPLERGGLFAIVGPTGSGKSSILDAMCLALYGTTPRTAGPAGAGPEVGSDGLSDRDPRGALSRGCAEGWAEADFAAGGREYTARWEVYRARRRPGGRLQEVRRSLVDRTGGACVAEKVRDVNEEVERRTGLGFEQFKRSVLLAQGEFAAFLGAAGDERARLLEAVTGLDIYAALSRKAFARGRDAEQETRRVEEELARVGAPDAGELDRLAREAGRARGEAAAVRGRLVAVEGELARFDEERRLAALLEEARGALRAAQERKRARAPRWAMLAAARKAWFVSAQHRAALDADRRCGEKVAAHAEADRVAALAAGELGLLARRLEEARRAHAEEAGRLEALRPDLGEAARLDGQLEAAAALFAEADARSGKLAAEDDEARQALERLLEEERKARERQAAQRAWLEERDSLRPVAAEWPRWESTLGRVRRLLEAHRSLSSEAEGLGRRADGLQGRIGALEKAAAAAVKKAAAARAAAIEAKEELAAHRAAFPGERTVARGKAAAAALVALEAAALHVAAGKEARERGAARRAEAEAAGRALERLRGRIGRLEAAEEAATAEAAACRAQAEQAALAAGLDEKRGALRPGEPCPLCGSRRHPWAGRKGTGGGKVARLGARGGGLEARAGKLREELGAMRAQAGRLEEAQEGAERQAQDAAREAAAAARREEGAKRKARAAIAKPGARGRPLLALLDGGRVEELAGKLGAEREEAEGAAARERALAARLEERQSGSQELADAEREAAAARAEAGRELSLARAQGEQKARELAGTLERLEGERRELDEVFVWGVGVAWESEMREDPAAFIARLGRGVREFAARGEAAALVEKEAAALAPRVERARALAAQGAAQAGEAAGRRDEARGALDGLREARGRLLGGRGAQEVEAELAGEVAALAERIARAEALEKDAALRAEAARAKAGRARAEREEAARERDAAGETLAAALAQVNLTREEAGGYLEKGRDFVDELEREAREVEEGVATAAQAARQREEDLAGHRARGAGEAGDEAACRELRGKLREEEAAVGARLAAIEAGQREGEGKRRRAEELGAALERARREGERWLVLRELVGHSEGKTLRLFAQGLTLERLVRVANERLEALAPRYRLRRVGEGLDLAVLDLDQASEERAVSSLSGGELFLVSLALALALARLSGRETPIRSLFIDEGFGSLDPASLEEALGALEALRSEGKTIGLVSHVEALRSRTARQVLVEPCGAGRSRVRVLDSGIE